MPPPVSSSIMDDGAHKASFLPSGQARFDVTCHEQSAHSSTRLAIFFLVTPHHASSACRNEPLAFYRACMNNACQSGRGRCNAE
jgi:hypothetical protein